MRMVEKMGLGILAIAGATPMSVAHSCAMRRPLLTCKYSLLHYQEGTKCTQLSGEGAAEVSDSLAVNRAGGCVDRQVSGRTHAQCGRTFRLAESLSYDNRMISKILS